MKITCCKTGKTIETKTNRLPTGWKRAGESIYSPEAWRQMYCLRAVVVPVAMPIITDDSGPQSETVKAAWDDLRKSLKSAWIRSTEAANWALRRLLSNEPTRQPGETKCPPMPKCYLYGERDWTGWSQSAAAVLRTIEATYRSRRYECIWTSSTALPNVSYPYPYPIHNAAWKLWQDDGGRIGFESRLPDGRVGVWLKTGPQWKRQIALLRYLISHAEQRGEASIYQKHDGTIVVKVVGWFPKREYARSEGRLILRTGNAEFIAGFNTADERLFNIPGDRCRDWIIRTDAMRIRWSDSMKHELRVPKRESRKNLEDMQRQVAKNSDRINTWIDQTIAACVGHAKRRRLASIAIDDSEKSFMPHFPWYRFLSRLEQVCNRESLGFERLSASSNIASTRVIASQVGAT